LKVQIIPLYFYISLVFMAGAMILLCGYNRRRAALAFLAALAIIFFSIVVSGCIIDTSYDGNGYRKIQTGLMKEGWNPVYETAEAYNIKSEILPREISFYGATSNWYWMDVCPKGLGRVGAVIYSLTGKFETGKCYTLLSMFILFFLCDYVLQSRLKRWQSISVSLCLAMNPVSMTQLRCFYIDAFLSNIVLITFIVAVLFFQFEDADRPIALLAMCAGIIWGFSSKFNGIFFLATLCVAVWLIVLQDKNLRIWGKKVFICFSAAALGGGVLIFPHTLQTFCDMVILCLGLLDRTRL